MEWLNKNKGRNAKNKYMKVVTRANNIKEKINVNAQ